MVSPEQSNGLKVSMLHNRLNTLDTDTVITLVSIDAVRGDRNNFYNHYPSLLKRNRRAEVGSRDFGCCLPRIKVDEQYIDGLHYVQMVNGYQLFLVCFK